ncbi:MAG: antitoxin [Actinomycetia bacterium]|nr:antitoxin [Actinomycetes bacterium]
MSTSTTTIRVAVQTRDLLAAQARQRGISLAALLAELAAVAERDAMFHAELEAERRESAAAVRDEEQDWETTAEDGIG